MEANEILKHAVDLATQAGTILLRHFDDPEQNAQQTKTSDVDIVTAADRAAEEVIVAELVQRFPDHHIVGEEGGGQGAPAAEAHYFWYVDPIDGTSNFASGIPHFCTSLALTDADRIPLVSVVYDPNRDELFAAKRGQGATLNGHPMRVSDTDRLIHAILASGFPYDKLKNPENNLQQWNAFLLNVRGLRRMGSAALDLAYVAAGRFAGYWERGLYPWDALGGMLLVQEAGGRVTDYHGGETPQNGPDGKFVASNGHIHDAMLAILQDTLRE